MDLEDLSFDENFIKNQLGEILNDAQDKLNFDVSEGIEQLKKLLTISNTRCNVVKIFTLHFKNCLEKIISPSSSHATSISNVVYFISKFLVDLIETGGNQILFLIAWRDILAHLLDNHRSHSDTVRLRICQILRTMLKLDYSQTGQVNIFNDTRKKLQNCLIERMKDVEEDIQLEAIKALRYLQDTEDQCCPVVFQFTFMLKNNSLSLKSRLEILDTIALYLETLSVSNSETLPVLQKLIYNKEVEIRLKVYEILIERISVNLFDDKYGAKLLKCLMKEEAFLSEVLLTKLINKWLKNADYNYLKFISIFNFKKFYNHFSQKSLHNFMNMAFDIKRFDYEKKFLQDCELENDFNLYDLRPNAAFYFRSLLFYFKSNCNDDNEWLTRKHFGLDSLTFFGHIVFFVHEVMVDDAQQDAEHIFILEQLFDALFYHKDGFAPDFLGRFEEEIELILCGAKKFNEYLFDILFKQWKLLETGGNRRLKKLATLIVKIEELHGSDDLVDANNNTILVSLPEKQKSKSDAIKTCLFIMCQLLNDSETLQEMHEILQANLEDLILTNICSPDPRIRVLAVRALGLSCLLSVDLALSYLLLFVKMTESDTTCVIVEAQKALFNILLCFNGSNLDDCLKINYEVKFIACEGFAKLFLSRRINNNVELLSTLILILFDPSLDNEQGTEIKDCLLSFFLLYTRKYNLSIFEQVMLKTVDVVLNSQSDLSFSKINLKNLANYFLCLINYNENAFKVHDRILFQLLERMRIELEFNKNMDTFYALLLVLLEFYNPEDTERTDGEMMKKIEETIKSIMEIVRQKSGFPANKLADFKVFISFVEECLKKNTPDKSRSSSSKRKSILISTEDDEMNCSMTIKSSKKVKL